MTACPAEKIRARRWVSKVWLFRRDTDAKIEEIYGYGATGPAAMTDGLDKAKERARIIGMPSDWREQR